MERVVERYAAKKGARNRDRGFDAGSGKSISHETKAINS